MNKDKLEYYSYLTITMIGIGILAYIFFKYLLFACLPFLIAWGVAVAIRPFCHKISLGTRISERFISFLFTSLIVLGGLSVLISVIAYAIGQAWGFLTELVEGDALYDVLQKVMNPLSGFLGDREGAEELRAHINTALKSTIGTVVSSLVESITSFVTSVPRVLIFILVTVIASIYFSLDIDKINSTVRKVLPPKLSQILSAFKNRFLLTLLKYVRAYLIIMLVTFIVMLFGFLVLGIKYAVLFAFIVALLDVLPLIGVGTVLVPWSVYQILFGKLSLGIGLVVLFVVNVIIRQFIEPKIVGKHLGIHPIISLILLYSGYYLFGFFGLLLIPFFSVIINILIKEDDAPKVE